MSGMGTYWLVDESTKCWNWIKSVDSGGYGKFYLNGRTLSAHRQVARHHIGDIEGKFVLHKCDNPRCVNPEHLWIGTHQDNMDDMKSKGRNSSPRAVGERNGASTLTRNQVVEIRGLLAEGKGLSEIARMFGVTHVCIWSIRSKRTWAHI